MKDYIWSEKYRPSTLDDYVFQNSQHRSSFQQFVDEKTIPHLLLSGVQGVGKTTVARVLISAMELDDTDVLTINASDDRGIDTFRDIVKNFANSMAFGAFKIIHLEEADALTPAAQAALKSFMEEVHDSVRFILTCNHENKIIPPIKSRCQHFHFKAGDKNDIAERMVTILASEGVKFDLDLLDTYVAAGFPDIRKIINTLQQNTVSGVLQPPTSVSTDGDYRFDLLTCLNAGDWAAARALVLTNTPSDQIESVYKFLYDNVSHVTKWSQAQQDQAIVTIAEYLYKHAFVADTEICLAACFIQLSSI